MQKEQYEQAALLVNALYIIAAGESTPEDVKIVALDAANALKNLLVGLANNLLP